MSIAGTWNITMNSPMGAQSATLDLKVDGGSVTGSMKSPMGEIEISEGTADGDSATWKATLTQPMAITMDFTAKAEGDSISGKVALGSFGNADFSGTRA